MRSGAAFLGFLISAGLGYAVGYTAGAGGRSGPPLKKARPLAEQPEQKPKTRKTDVYQVPVGNAHQKGPKDALVTIVEFSEFECPFCKRVQPTLEALFAKYQGQIRLVFKHQPLAFHLRAPRASEYALAAGAQGKFWQMHDLLFENQGALKEEDLRGYAEQIGLDMKKLDAFLASGDARRTIRADQDLARSLGATGTPTFFINGVRLTGAQPLKNFQEVIDAELEKARTLVEGGVAKTEVYGALTKNGWTEVPRARRPAQPPTTRRKVKLVEGTPHRGGETPLVTLVAFSDFQCPFCARVNPTLKRILDAYGDKVQLRFRNQPLEFHKRAVPAARAALAAHRQGKFWPMHDLLFSNQRDLGDRDFKTYAKRLGLKLKRFEKDLHSEEVGQRLAADQRDARRYGARATPTIFVNGIPIRGAKSFETFKKVIDMEIERALGLMGEGVKKEAVYQEILRREGGKEVKIPGSA